MPNSIAFWLIEMHSKYPDAFNVGAREGSCSGRALDKLVPIGKYREWAAIRKAKKKRKGRVSASKRNRFSTR
jgi:hypothetical protein